MNGDQVIITEREVLKSTPREAQWCLKRFSINFKHNGKTGIDSLSGYWQGVRAYDKGLYYELGVSDNNGVIHRCEPGDLRLWRNSEKDTAKTPPPPVAKVSDRPRDGYYDKTAVATSKVSEFTPLREADVVFAKRIWREIDVREKMNTYLASPNARLIDVLLDGLKDGKFAAYSTTPTEEDPGGDMFTKQLTIGQALGMLSDSSVVTKRDADNNIIDSKLEANTFDPDSLVRFRIKEDWVFDKQRSVFEPRIIGIAPMIRMKVSTGAQVDMQPAFWIYFPHARPLLAVKAISNENNDQTGLSFDDAFMKRMFASYIVKQSNAKDERIKDYMQGIDRLYEAQRVAKQLMDWELDLWQY
ncbi:gliding motility protein GldN [Mucilaginibacter myungsuensis]|uniref:Gliding motility protein GldN n=2 Tax=Mucilaginibacter myungsuensis TaxID=649104 RepID=A0A929KU82_9SPHI|nr:gliding motility protein GldN [Mucilaginibacter myungsuensis]